MEDSDARLPDVPCYSTHSYQSACHAVQHDASMLHDAMLNSNLIATETTMITTLLMIHSQVRGIPQTHTTQVNGMTRDGMTRKLIPTGLRLAEPFSGSETLYARASGDAVASSLTDDDDTENINPGTDELYENDSENIQNSIPESDETYFEDDLSAGSKTEDGNDDSAFQENDTDSNEYFD